MVSELSQKLTVGMLFLVASALVAGCAGPSQVGGAQGLHVLQAGELPPPEQVDLAAYSRPYRVGPFDEGFRLFFEETDWLLRAKRLGLRSEYVPGAEAIHLYNRSAAKEPRSRDWFEESARRFRRLHYGAGFSWLLERMPERGSPELPVLKEIPVEPGVWVEVSPNPDGFPALVEKLIALEHEPMAWEEDVKALKTPVLIIAGDADVATLEHSVAMFRLLGGGDMGDMGKPLAQSRLVVMPATSHTAVITQPDLLHAFIEPFLKDETPKGMFEQAGQ